MRFLCNSYPSCAIYNSLVRSRNCRLCWKENSLTGPFSHHDWTLKYILNLMDNALRDWNKWVRERYLLWIRDRIFPLWLFTSWNPNMAVVFFTGGCETQPDINCVSAGYVCNFVNYYIIKVVVWKEKRRQLQNSGVDTPRNYKHEQERKLGNFFLVRL